MRSTYQKYLAVSEATGVPPKRVSALVGDYLLACGVRRSNGKSHNARAVYAALLDRRYNGRILLWWWRDRALGLPPPFLLPEKAQRPLEATA